MLSIYKASAGSGKTYRLTQRYIIQLLGYQDKDGEGRWHLSSQTNRHRAILAITFTNMATDEMKRRILHELAVLGGMEPGWEKPSPHLKELLKTFGCTEAALKKAAAQALRSILLDYGRFNVSTIDAFFQTILRTFAREAELMGNYELDMEKKPGIKEGIERLLSDISKKNPDPQLYAWFKTYLESNMLNNKNFNVFSRSRGAFADIVDFVDTTTDQVYYDRLDEISAFIADRENITHFRKALQSRIEELKEGTAAQFKALSELIDKSGWEKGFSADFKKFVKSFDDGWGAKRKPAKTPENIMNDPVNAFVKEGKKLLDKGQEPFKGCLQVILKAFQDFAEAYSKISYYEILLDNIYKVGLMSTVMNYIKEYRSETSTFFIDETNSLLHRIIGNDDAPFVYERIGMQLRHFLIDEFQDTSRQQWQNLLPLVGNSLSEGNDNLVIGDEKQSIYRFRGSDPELLATLHDEIGSESEVEGADSEGNTNWRSAPVVVDFNNRHFSRLVEKIGSGMESYGNVCQQSASKNAGIKGYVMLNLLTKEQNNNGEGFAFTLREMNRQLGSGGYHARDLAVLVKKTKVANAFIEYFMAHAYEYDHLQGIKLISDDSLNVNNSPAVKMVVTAMKYRLSAVGEMVNPGENESREVKGRRFNYALEYFLSQSGGNPDEAIRNALNVAHNGEEANSLDAKMCSIDSVTLQGLVGRLIHDLVPEDLKRQQAVYLTAFQDLVADYSKINQADLKSFLDWWEEKSKTALVSGTPDINSIRVMTIHKSKGLEFKCVHIPTTAGQDRSPSEKWFEVKGLEDLGLKPECLPKYYPLTPKKELADTPLGEQYQDWGNATRIDELNKLYVGYTRAINELVVNVVEVSTNQSIQDYTGTALFERFALEGYKALDVEEIKVEERRFKTLGSPTQAVETAKERSGVLEASETAEVPPFGAQSTRNLWKLTRLDESAAIGRQEALRQVMLHVGSAATLDKALRRCDLPRLSADDAQLLRRRIAEQPALFDVKARVLNRHMLVDGRGGTRACDRIVFHPDGSATIVNYLLPYEEELTREQQMESLGVRKRLLRRSGLSRVKALLWDLESGDIKESLDEPKG